MTDEELRVLAWTLLGEAAGEGSLGMQAVAHVIRNRAESGRFPSNPAAVALQSSSSGTHQFSTWNALTNGGNLPRARFPVGSAQFNQALSIVNKVFSPTPGADPTLGATHYYSPRGMDGGEAPYWWSSEAPLGGKKVGNHIFAIKRDPAVPSPPKDRPVRFGDNGSMPSKNALEVFRTGQPIQLPKIGPTGGPSLKSAPKPASQSAKMQEQRLNPSGDVGVTSTVIFDPISGNFIPKSVSSRQAVRDALGEQGSARGPLVAKQAQRRVAGFAVPDTGSMAEVDASRRSSAKSAGRNIQAAREEQLATQVILNRPKSQTQFAVPRQPAGVVKDETQLVSPTGLPTAPGLLSAPSRDAVAQRKAGQAMAAQLAGKPVVVAAPPAAPKIVAPIPHAPIYRPPAAAPRLTDAPLKIVVESTKPMAVQIAKSPVTRLREQGYTSAQAYDLANQQASDRAIANSGRGDGGSLWRTQGSDSDYESRGVTSSGS